MEILVKAGQFLLSLSLLIILHEMGHFILAKIFNTRVEKFYLFFNPWFSLFKKKIGETEYGIGWLPLGGYVKISGMIDESMDKEQMKHPPQPYEFRSKPSWQRLLIMLGGVLVNFLFAIAIYVMILHTWGETYLPVKNMTYGIMVDSTGANLGLKNGDKILAIDGEPVENYHSIVQDIVMNEAKTVQVERNGRKMEIELPKNAIASLIKSRASHPSADALLHQRLQPRLLGLSVQGFEKGDRVIALDEPFDTVFRPVQIRYQKLQRSGCADDRCPGHGRHPDIHRPGFG